MTELLVVACFWVKRLRLCEDDDSVFMVFSSSLSLLLW
jgi:hypothetical protein